MLKPCASFSLAVGNLSAAAGSGGGATGASFMAASLSGRPIIGEPGGRGDGAACALVGAGAAAGGGAADAAGDGAGAGAAAGADDAAGAGAAAGGDAGVSLASSAAAARLHAPRKTPASNSLRGDKQIIMTFLPV